MAGCDNLPRQKTKAEFHHAISVLKEKGIIPSRIDARKAEPFNVTKSGPQGGTYTLRELVDKYDDVISGKATPVKLSESETKAYKRLGYETHKGKVIIPHSANESVKVERGRAVITHPKGIERVQLPIEYHNLEQFLDEAMENADEIDRMKNSREYFSFNFYGYGTSQIFSNIDQLLETFRHYKAADQAIGSKSSRRMNEVYRNLEIVRTSKMAWRKRLDETARKRRNREGEYSKHMKALRKSPARLAAHKSKEAAKAKAYRDKLKANPEAYAKYKADAKKRARKSQGK